MRSRFFVAFNPTAGTSRAAAVEQLIGHLEHRGARVVRATATTAEAARMEARDAAVSCLFDALVACGGDGTVRQLAAAAAGTDCAVGAFMLGTGNVLAHELNLPRKPEAFAALLTDGPVRSVRLGLANGDPFVLMAGVGFDGRTIANLDHGIKQRIAKAAFVPATLKALAAPPDALEVDVDGRHYGGVSSVIVTSASRYGGAFRITSKTSLAEEGFIAVLLRAQTKADMLRHSVAIARGTLDHLATLDETGVTMVPCRHVTIHSATPVPAQIDGDAFGATPLVVNADGPHVGLIAPALK